MILRDTQYPDGWGVLIAWDYSVEGRLAVSTLLLRAGEGQFIVHRSVDDGVVREQVYGVSADEALALYEHMPMHFAPFPTIHPDRRHDEMEHPST